MTDEQEFIDEAPATEEESQRPPTVVQMLQYELRERMKTALDYKTKIETAKTEHKKKYYGKKLKKNNVEAMKILTAIERVKKNQTQREAATSVQQETDE